MQEPEAFLIHLLTTKRQLDNEVLSPIFLANLYTNSALLGTVSSYILEQHWLEEKQNQESKIKTNYSLWLTNLILLEIPAIGFLEGYLQRESLKGLKQIIKTSKAIEKSILSRILCSTGPQKKSFLIRSLEEMTIHFLLEEKFQKNREQSDGHRGPCLYRTFDGLDDIFELNYKLDQEMAVQKVAKERLYERAGIGVQSGYSTILLALHAMEANAGDKVIDLGSGYGRVGLVCSLMREDLYFTGYEYVPHRVEIANRACKILNLDKSLVFLTQDLSLPDFRIPLANTYYLYDPFTYETYQSVLKQIVEISKTQKVKIITKGNARSWVSDLAKENNWPEPLILDEGNLCLFTTEI